MGEFKKRVQANRVTGPLRRGFTPDGWAKEFNASLTSDDDDKDIYAVGLVIYEKLQNIRAQLKLSTSESLSATTKLRAFVAAANHNFMVARDKTRAAIAKAAADRARQAANGFGAEELAAVKLNLPGGFDWSPNEVIESLVDGIEIPVRVALQATPDLAGNPRMGQIKWGDIALELNLGIMYRHTEDLWDDCLWNGYKLFDKERLKAFLPQDPDLIRGYIVGLSRRQSLSIAFNVLGTKVYREMVARGTLPNIRDVRAIKRQGKRQTISVSKPGQPTAALEELIVMRSLASEPYYTELLGEPLPALDGLTLSLIIDAWIVISRVSLILVESVGQKHVLGLEQGSAASTWLPEYTPVLHVSALVDALSAAAGISPGNGRRLIEFFTFRGQPSQEIWSQPLVPVGAATVAPVFAAIVSPNLRRLIDVWMRQGGVDLSRRGPAFEAHIRATVADSIDTSQVLAGHAACIREDYTFRPSQAREEQIDLIFTIGSTVFVAEAKCILEPTETKAVAMHRKTVDGAAEQALRKAHALEANRGEFVADLKRWDIDLPEDFKVTPLIVVSTSTHVGISAKGIPVIDEFILGRFLAGELDDVAIHGRDFTFQKRLKTIFYSNVQEAEAKAAEYFASPPQLQRFLKGVRRRVVPLHAIDEQDWEGRILTLECVLDGGLPIAQQPDVVSDEMSS